MAVWDDPERVWAVVLSLVESALPDDYGAIGAGPLEDLVARYAPGFIDRIEAEAASNHRFRGTLGRVWVNSRYQAPDIVARLVAASGGVIEPMDVDYDEEKRNLLDGNDGA